MEKRVLKLLYRSLDSALKERDRRKLDSALTESKELRQCRDEILSLRRAVPEGADRSFRAGFEDRIMSRLRSAPEVPNRLEILAESYRWILHRLAAVSVFVLIILIAAVLLQDGMIPKDAVFYVSDTTISGILQVPVL